MFAQKIVDTILNNTSNPILSTAQSQLVDFLTTVLIKALNITQNFEVIDIVDAPQGKWNSELGNVIVIDSKYIVSLFMEKFLTALNETSVDSGNFLVDSFLTAAVRTQEFQQMFANISNNIDIDQYALTLNVLLNQREEVYTSNNTMKNKLIQATDALFTSLGLNYPASVTPPLADAMDTFFSFKILLDSTFQATIMILVLLSIVLIYSLMNSNLQEKKFEFGMLRTLGIKKNDLIILICLQSLFFAVPGVILGFAFAYAIFATIGFVVSNSALLEISYHFPGLAIGLGVGMGLLIPFVANIIPMRKALSNTLTDSLNAYTRGVSDVSIYIVRLTKAGISPAKFVAALILIVFGFFTYYLAPYAFVYSNYSLFYIILNIVLVFMIIGLTLLSNLLRKPLERFVLLIILVIFGKYKTLRSVIMKNFQAHQSRNKSTSLMFTIALAFLIFAGSGFKLNANMLINQLKTTLGSDFVITATSSETSYLQEYKIRETMENLTTQYPNVIRGYSFISQSFTDQPLISTPNLAPLTQTPKTIVEIVSIDETYFQSIYDEFYLPDGYDNSVQLDQISGTTKLDAAQALYLDDGLTNFTTFDSQNILAVQNLQRYNLDQFIGDKEVRFIISEGLSKYLSLPAGNSGVLNVGSTKFSCKIRITATKVPGFSSFSGYKSSSANTLLTSHEDYRLIRDVVWGIQSDTDTIEAYNETIPENSTYGVPKLGFMLGFEDNVDDDTKALIENSVRTLIDGQYTFTTDVAGTIEILQDALVFIDVFSLIISAIAIILSFFFTIVAFVGNVSENLWEFGILRAIGFTKSQMTQSYIFEALSIIITGCFLGTAIGVGIALLSALQIHITTELPLDFIFPYAVFAFSLAASLLTATIGSKVAVDEVKNRQISSIIKALD